MRAQEYSQLIVTEVVDIQFLLRHNNGTFYSPITKIIKLFVLT